jgi:hypothetical protein
VNHLKKQQIWGPHNTHCKYYWHLCFNDVQSGKQLLKFRKNLMCSSSGKGACGSVVGWGTLQDRWSSFRITDEADFFNLPNPSSRTITLGSTQPLTKMRTRNLPGGKKRPARRADNLAAIYEQNVWKCGSLNLPQP